MRVECPICKEVLADEPGKPTHRYCEKCKPLAIAEGEKVLKSLKESGFFEKLRRGFYEEFEFLED